MKNVSGSTGPNQPNKPIKNEQVPEAPKQAADNFKKEMESTGSKPANQADQKPSELNKKDGEIQKAMKDGADRDALTGKRVKDDVVKKTMDKAKQQQPQQPGVVPGQAQGQMPQGGGVQSAQGAGQTAPASGTQEMAELATQMTDRILASAEGKNEVRMTFGDSNPNMKGVEVSVKMDGENLSLEFQANTPEAANYIAQNQGGLVKSLKEQMPDVPNIAVDIQEQSADSDGQPQGESRGQYIPQEEPEQ